MSRQYTGRMKRHQGMALVLVLWIVAALSIFATSLGKVVRQEASVVGVTRDMAAGRARGEAAIYQVLQQIALKPQEFSERRVEQVPWGGQIIEVEILPWSGLVNINAASPELLGSLFTRMGLGQGSALAQALVEFRQAGKGVVNSVAWEAPEDLLQIPGVTYGIYAQIRPFIVADTDGRTGINPKAAPAALLAALDGAGGAAFQESLSSPRYRLTARVVFDGGSVMVVRDADVIGGGSRGSLPWTLLSATQSWVGRI